MTGSSDALSTALPTGQPAADAGVRPNYLATFLNYLIPSVLGLLSISTASVVDGLLVARYIGPDALAAVNLLIPVITLYFGMVLMLAVGASVRATYCIAQNQARQASEIFANTMLLVMALAAVLVVAATLLQDHLFSLLGAPRTMFPLLREYFHILVLGWLPQVCAVVFYYFLRSLGYPSIATGALVIGAVVNIVLDWLFLSVLRWGLGAAAWATVAAQVMQCGVLWLLFLRLPHGLRWRPRLAALPQALRAGGNGFSEFVNEISVGLVLGVMHGLLLQVAGADALAGFALVNYSLFVHTMIGCAIAEAVYTLVSRNAGSGDLHRLQDARRYFRLGLGMAGIFAGIYTALLLLLGPRWIDFLFPGAAGHYSLQYLQWIWPAFIACACNLVLSARFTGLQKARASACIALLRSLIFPLLLLWAIYGQLLQLPLVAAIALAEWLTLAVAVGLCWRNGDAWTGARHMQQL